MKGRAALAAAVCRCYAEIGAVAKDGENSHFKYKFASAEAIFAPTRAAMAVNGLCLLPMLIGIRNEPADKQTFYSVEWQFLLIEATTGYTAVLPFTSEALDGQDKGINKALTSALKYFLRAVFLIPMEAADDPDASPEGSRPPKESKPKEPVQPSRGKPGESAGQRLRRLLGEASAAQFEARALEGKVSWSKVAGSVDDDAPASAFFDALEKAIAEKTPQTPETPPTPEPAEERETLAGETLRAAAEELRTS